MDQTLPFLNLKDLKPRGHFPHRWPIKKHDSFNGKTKNLSEHTNIYRNVQTSDLKMNPRLIKYPSARHSYTCAFINFRASAELENRSATLYCLYAKHLLVNRLRKRKSIGHPRITQKCKRTETLGLAETQFLVPYMFVNKSEALALLQKSVA